MKTQSAIAILSLLLISSACPGSGPDNRPDFNTTYPDIWDIELVNPQLTYDLNKFIEKYKTWTSMYPHIDLQEMLDWHGIFPEGNTVSFMNLLSNSDDYPGAEVKFVFSEPNCSGHKEITFTSYDADLCERNIIQNAPKVTKKHLVEFSAKTRKTSVSELQIKWYKEYLLSGNSIFQIDVEGKTLYPGIPTKSTNGTTIGGRPNNQGGYDYIPNTTGSLTTGTYEQGPIVSLVEVPPVLTQNVCYDGEISPAMSWDIPVEIMLIPE